MTCRAPHILLLVVAAAVTLAGCRWMPPQNRPADVDVDTLDTEALRDQYHRMKAHADDVSGKLEERERELVQRSIELENQREANRLLQSELDATLADLRYLERQFVTLEHELTREESKASAVATLADAQVLYDRFQEARAGELAADEWAEIDKRMSSAEAAMSSEHYAAAAYHAHRAMRLLRRSQREQNSFLSTEGQARVVFVPVANVRKGPGGQYTVASQLARGTVVMEVEVKGDWKRVRMRSGADGWIHASLLR